MSFNPLPNYVRPLRYRRGMKFLLSHNSALEYWRTHDLDSEQKPTRAKAEFSVAPYPELRNHPEIPPLLNSPIHVTVTERLAWRKPGTVICHIALTDIPQSAYRRLGREIYLSSPEACFLQMASHLTLVELITLGCEICGSYAPLASSEGLAQRKPRTTVRQLVNHIDLSKGSHGIKAARKGVRYVFEEAASPAETALALLLCLPTYLGGYGLPRPVLNKPLRVQGKVVRCDLFWPDHRFALEYDSNLHHVGAEKINADSARRTLIEGKNVHVVSVTWDQVRDARKFDILARAVAQHLGFRVRTMRSDSMMRRYQLRKQLFSPWKAPDTAQRELVRMNPDTVVSRSNRRPQGS